MHDSLKKLKEASVSGAKKTAKALVLKALIYVGILLVILKLIFGVYDYLSSRYKCHTQWVESGIEYKYTYRAGCLLKRNDAWIPSESFRVE